MPTAIRRWGPNWALVVVCLAHAVSPVLLVGIHHYFGADEAVYLSQYSRHVPALLFTAPRSRGVPFLVAPVTLLTSSVVVLRSYLTVLSAIGLYVGFAPWLRLRLGYAVPLAALLFASVWPAIYYADEAMPNEWVAYAVVAAVGLLLRYQQERRAWQLVWLAVSLAWLALLRPSDALYLGAVVVLVLLLTSGWSTRRRLATAAVAIGGLGAGWADWLIEAVTRYGGVSARVHEAQAENGGSGIHFALAAQARALAGPLLCRRGCHASAAYLDRAWWFVGAALVIVAVVVASAHLRVVVVSVVAGLALLVEYSFSVTYAAPRFFLPAYALLSVPAAVAACWLARRSRVVLAVLLLVLAAHLAIQARLTQQITSRTHEAHFLADAHALQGVGVRPPCVLRGTGVQITAFALRCSDRLSLARGPSRPRVAFLSPRPPGVGTIPLRWRRYRVPGVGEHDWYAAVSPAMMKP